ncbi:hypothetical protein OG809_33220 [Kribbella soli]
MARELGGAVGRSSKPVCFILGAGCSLTSDAPSTKAVDEALRDATSARFDGMELRDALHVMPEHEKQDILRPLFARVRPARGYLALAALAKHRLVTVLNLNWDDALTQACEQAHARCEVRDIRQLEPDWPGDMNSGLINLHVHGMVGDECRYGRIETLSFTAPETEWLLTHGLAYTTVIIGASMEDETDFTGVFDKWAEANGNRRPTASQWFFSRSARDEGPADRLRSTNVRTQAFTNVREPGVDFDTIATLITDRALGTILGSTLTTGR